MVRSVFSPAYREFRRMLINARKDAKATQAALAARLRRPQSFVAKYEQGERRIDVVEFLEIAEALAIKPETFIARLRANVKRAGPSRGRRRSGSSD